MPELKRLEHYLLRYVPVAVREEFVNIGVILLDAERGGFADFRFAPDWKAVERIDPQADIEMLQAIERFTREQFQDAGSRALFLRKMEDSFSGMIQLSPMNACLAEDPAKEIEVLATLYFKNVHQPAQRAATGRNRIWQQMRSAFEQQGILGALMTDIPMEKYTEAGDPLKLDFAYVVNKTLKVFQAVPLKGNLGPANYFGSRARGIVDDLARKTGAAPLLTAVVDDDWDRVSSDVKYALDTLVKSHVDVAVLADMPKIAERARLELLL